MKILKITDKTIDAKAEKIMEAHGLSITCLSPTPLSAFTSYKVSRAVDRLRPDVVEVSRQKDALAALSAKKISKNNGYKVVYVVEPNSVLPPVFHTPVIEGVAAWVLPSQRLFDLYPSTLKNKQVVEPVSITVPEVEAPKEFDAPLTLAWIGDIVDNRPLKQLLEMVDQFDGAFNLRISGAGVAREVMPAVRLSRALEHSDKVVWVGEEYKLAQEISRCHSAVRTSDDLTLLESMVLQTGRRVIAIDEIDEFLSHPTAADIDRCAVPRYLDTLLSIYNC